MSQVEGGLIDTAHHRSTARMALDETVEFDLAINTTIHLLKTMNKLDDTLVIVTSDHANSLSINGYPKRGNNILDVAGKSTADDVKYTTLTYSIGYAQNPVYKRYGSDVIRQDPTVLRTTSHEYKQQVGIPEHTGVHGGSDVAVYAKGMFTYISRKIYRFNFLIKKKIPCCTYRTDGTPVPFHSRTKLRCTCNRIRSQNRTLPKWIEQQITHGFLKRLPHWLIISFNFVTF